MGRRLFLDEPSALPELMISLIRDALAAVRRMRRMRRGLRTPQAVSSKLYMRNSSTCPNETLSSISRGAPISVLITTRLAASAAWPEG